MCCAVLHLIVLCCVHVCCVVLCCTVLYCAVPCRAVPCYVVLCCLVIVCCDALYIYSWALLCFIMLLLCCVMLLHCVVIHCALSCRRPVLFYFSCHVGIVSCRTTLRSEGEGVRCVMFLLCYVMFCFIVLYVYYVALCGLLSLSWFLLCLVCPYRQRKWAAIQTSILDTYLFNLKRLSKTVGNGISNSKVIQSTSSDTAQFSSRL